MTFDDNEANEFGELVTVIFEYSGFERLVSRQGREVVMDYDVGEKGCGWGGDGGVAWVGAGGDHERGGVRQSVGYS